MDDLSEKGEKGVSKWSPRVTATPSCAFQSQLYGILGQYTERTLLSSWEAATPVGVEFSENAATWGDPHFSK